MYSIKNIGLREYSYASAFLLSYLCVLYFFYVLPFSSISSTGINYLVYGSIKSLSIDFSLFSSHTSYPLGGVYFTGLPYLILASLLVKMFDISVFVASNIAISIFILLSYLSFLYLIKSFTKNLILALLIPIAFFAMPIVIGKAGYGAMMIGFAMLPFYFSVFLYSQDSSKFLSKIILSAMFTFALFMDGYSYVFVVFMACITSFFSFICNRSKSNLLDLLFLVAAIFISVVLYKAYIPDSGSPFSPMPLDYFRGQGVDLVTLFVPQEKFYWVTNFLSYGASWDPLSFFTDGEMVYHSFLGYSFLLLFVLSIILLWGRVGSVNKPLMFSLVSISAISLLLSMGPSLKVNNINTSPDEKVSFQTYLMPEDKATFTMPYADLFVKVPGINNMRATHRWLLVFKFSTLMILSLLLSQLMKAYPERWVKVIVYCGVFLMVLEFWPNIASRDFVQKTHEQAYDFVDSEIIAQLKKQIPKHSVVAIYSDQNDYMSNYICAGANIKCLNTGGDKNIQILQEYWPRSFIEMRDKHDVVNNAYALLNETDVNIIILPKFDLRWDSYNDKIRSVDLDKYNIRYSKFRDNDKFTFNDNKHFVLLKLNN